MPELREIKQDSLALSVAGALAVADKAAIAQGTDLTQSLVTIPEETLPPDRLWRVHYGPWDCKNRRGGDLIVLVDEKTGLAQQIIHRQ